MTSDCNRATVILGDILGDRQSQFKPRTGRAISSPKAIKDVFNLFGSNSKDLSEDFIDTTFDVYDTFISASVIADWFRDDGLDEELTNT